MPGFTGGSDKGETVLLGRNGSDYSAAVLAACVDAECCEIWTDVEVATTATRAWCRMPTCSKPSPIKRRWSSPTSVPRCCTPRP